MKKGLTRNVTTVLHGLVKYPTLNDRELSEEVGVRHSTVTAIRRRLHERGYFRTVRIPDVRRLGYELTIVEYGGLNPSASRSEVERFTESLRKENKGLYYLLASSDFYLHMSAARNYTSFRRWKEKIEFEFSDTNLFDGTTSTSVVLPNASRQLAKQFDYSRPLGLIFGLKDKVTLEPTSSRIDAAKLTKKERTVLRGLVEHPELTDVALCEEIDASRQVVSSMKKRFERSGLIRTSRVVDLRKLGFEIYSFGHTRLNPPFPLSERAEGLSKTLRIVPQFIFLATNTESVICSAFQSYDEYFRTRKELLSLYARKGLGMLKPTSVLVPLSETDIPINCDYSGLILDAIKSFGK